MRLTIGVLLITIIMQQVQIFFIQQKIDELHWRTNHILSMLLDFMKKVQRENNE